MEHKLNHIKNCPICGSENHKTWLESKDYSASKEDFKIVQCDDCGFKFTNPIPHENEIGAYYKSEHYISHTDSNRGLMNKVYKWVRNRAIKNKEQLIAKASPGKNLLDIGCGTGDFLKYCNENKWNCLGLEPDEDARNIALSKGVESQDITQLKNIESNSMDCVTMWHVLEHVYHLQADLDQIYRVLRTGGILVLALPNHSSWDAKKYGKFWAAYDLPIHLYHFVPNDIRNIAQQKSFDLEKILPMKWDAYYVSMLSNEHQGKNKWTGLINGFRSNMKANNETYSSQIYVLRKK